MQILVDGVLVSCPTTSLWLFSLRFQLRLFFAQRLDMAGSREHSLVCISFDLWEKNLWKCKVSKYKPVGGGTFQVSIFGDAPEDAAESAGIDAYWLWLLHISFELPRQLKCAWEKMGGEKGKLEMCSGTVGNNKVNLALIFCSSEAFRGLPKDLWAMFVKGHLTIFLKIHFLISIATAKSWSVWRKMVVWFDDKRFTRLRNDCTYKVFFSLANRENF